MATVIFNEFEPFEAELLERDNRDQAPWDLALRFALVPRLVGETLMRDFFVVASVRYSGETLRLERYAGRKFGLPGDAQSMPGSEGLDAIVTETLDRIRQLAQCCNLTPRPGSYHAD